MPFSPNDFADDTDFERLVLDRLGTYPVRATVPGAVFDMRAGSGRVLVSVGAIDDLGGAAREELRRSLRPVGFIAAFKVLDLLIEHTLSANRRIPQRVGYAAKAKMARSLPSERAPAPLDHHPPLWRRLVALYDRLADPRHAITHRRASVTSSGDLAIYNDARRLTNTLTVAEISSFAAAVDAVAEAVIGVDGDSRRINLVRWHLNRLGARHGFRSLAATDPGVGRRTLVVNLDPLESGRYRFDVAAARKVVDGQPTSYWDLELHADPTVFRTRWEDVPTRLAQVIEFDPVNPPGWLV